MPIQTSLHQAGDHIDEVAWEGWNMPGMENNPFVAMMNGLLNRSER